MHRHAMFEEPRRGAEPAHHVVKAWTDHFRGLWDKSKRHEVRRSDRDYREGDRITICEYAPDRRSFTGRWVSGAIGHVTPSGPIGANARLPEMICVFTFIEFARADDGDPT